MGGRDYCGAGNRFDNLDDKKTALAKLPNPMLLWPHILGQDPVISSKMVTVCFCL